MSADVAGVATPQATLNDTVIRVFDSLGKWLADLPTNGVTTWMQGALALTRRTLFNQLPTAHPVQITTSEDIQVVGTLGVVDPEGDPVTYRLATAPKFGTVQIAPDGTYTYTPSVYSSTDTFTVAVSDNGFNLLDPFSNRTIEPSVGLVGWTRGYDVVNMSGHSVVLTGVRVESGYESYPEYLPKVGTVVMPGDSVHAELGGSIWTGYDTRLDFSVCDGSGPTCDHSTPLYTVKFRTAAGNSSAYGVCESGACSFNPDRSYQSYNNKVFLIDNPGTTVDIYPDTPYGAQVLANLLDWYSANSASAKVGASFNNVTFANREPADSELSEVANLDNKSDNKGSTIAKTISTTFSATQSRSQTCSVPGCTYDLSQLANPGNYITVISGLLKGELAKNYGVTESETQSKTFTTTTSLTAPPWSVNRIMAAAPQLDANGDVTLTYETYCQLKCGDVQSGAIQTFVFHNMDFVYPDLDKSSTEPVYVIRTEPYQPKDANGQPKPNIGFHLADKNSPVNNPTLEIGNRHQLAVSAYNGFGGDYADFTRRVTYSSSDPSVVNVDAAGVLQALHQGSATITARYDWTIANAKGNLTDYVWATMDVTVLPRFGDDQAPVVALADAMA